MKGQIFFSFILAILSFVFVRNIKQTGIERSSYVLSPVFQKEFGWFDLTQPSYIQSLPYELREVSGVTTISNDTVACIQDEDGIIYYYDLNSASVIKKINFGDAGDYEGLAKVDSNFYIIRSDAALFKTSKVNDSTVSTETYTLTIPSLNNEGLCFDKKENRLLIAPKSKLGKGHEYKNLRSVYAFDLKTNKTSENPILQFNIDQIIQFALQNNIPLPIKENDNISFEGGLEFNLKFKPSSIAVHPLTDDIYIVSAVDKTMCVFNKQGELINYMLLDASIFNKPEGITFLEDGDMIITNEGQMGTPTLLRFNWNIGKH